MKAKNSRLFRGWLMSVLFLAVVAGANPLFGQQTTTRPTAGPLARLRGALSALSALRNSAQPFTSTQAEWDQILRFLDRNSPIRAARLRELNLAPTAPLRIAITRYYRGYLILADNLPELADIRLKRVGIEDDLFGLVEAGREGRIKGDDLKSQIRDKETALFDNGIAEQKLRIEMLKNLLDSETQKMDQEQNLRQTVIGSQTNVLFNRAQTNGSSPSGSEAPVTAPASPQSQTNPTGNPLTGSLPGNISDEQWVADLTALSSPGISDEWQFPAVN